MNILFTSSTSNLGFETYVAPIGFDRGAQPIDIYDVFNRYYKGNKQARYIYSVPESFTTYSRLAPNENPLHSDGTSYRVGYEIAGVNHVEDYNLTTAVGLYPDAYYDTITVVSTAGYPNSGKISLGKSYAVCIYNNTPASGFFTYTSKDATHFYGVSQRITFFADYIVAPVIDWTGKTKRYVIVNNTNMAMQSMGLSNYIKADWLYVGDKINSVSTGTGSIGGSTTKWIHIHKLNQITSYAYCAHYQSNLYGELHLSENPACTYMASSAFPNQSNITGILDIPSNFTELNGDYGGCLGGLGVTEIRLHEGLITIGTNALVNNTKVNVPIVIPNSVTTIKYGALRNIGTANGGINLPLNIPANVTSLVPLALTSSRFTPLTSDAPNFIVEDDTIYDITGGHIWALHGDFSKTNTISLKIGTSIILDYCFYNSLRTGNLVLANTINEIRSVAFYNAQGLTGTLTLPSNLTILTDSSFAYCIGFTSIVWNAMITTIERAALYSMFGMTGNLVIPDTVTYIGVSAIQSWRATGTLTLPNSNCTIEAEAFWVSSFTGVLSINSSISIIKTNAFGNNSFNDVTSSNTDYPVSDHVLYDVKTAGKVKANYSPKLYSGTLTLRGDTTSILQYAFYNNQLRTGTLIIPSGVTSIELAAFYSNIGFIGSLTIPPSVLTVAGDALAGLTGLTGSIIINSINISLSILSNGNASFNGCSNVTGLELISGYNAIVDFRAITNNFSASSLNQSILNITDGTIGSPKNFQIGATNKARLLASYPSAETDANIRHINII